MVGSPTRSAAAERIHDSRRCGSVKVTTLFPLPSPHGACTRTTTAKTTAADTILTLDLSKYKSVACLYRSADDRQFTTIPTSRTELTRLFARHQPTVVLIEACLLCGWVRDLCLELGLRCLVANTTSEAWKFKHLKRKTDRDDALRLVEVYLLGKFPRATISDKQVHGNRAVVWPAAPDAGRTRAGPRLAGGGGKEARRTGQDGRGHQDCRDDSRGGAANRGSGRRLPGRAPAISDDQGGVGVWRSGAAAVSIERHGPSRPDHQARTPDVAQAAGGVRLVHAALQRVGSSGVPAIDARRQDAQETSDRGRGEEVAGAVLGDAA